MPFKSEQAAGFLVTITDIVDSQTVSERVRAAGKRADVHVRIHEHAPRVAVKRRIVIIAVLRVFQSEEVADFVCDHLRHHFVTASVSKG